MSNQLDDWLAAWTASSTIEAKLLTEQVLARSPNLF